MAYGDTISRQAAIDIISQHTFYNDYDDTDKCSLMDELRALPPAQPAQHIDADGTLWITVTDIEQVKRVIVDEEKSKFCRQFYMDAQPEQRTGKWIPSDSQCGIRCSACGVPVDDFCHSIDYIDLDYEPNFCPNCGLPMKGANNADTEI